MPRPSRRSYITQAIEEAGREDLTTFDPSYQYPADPQPGGPDHHVVVTFTAPANPLSVNATNGKHFWSSHVDKFLWQRAASQAFLSAAADLAPFRGHRIELTFCLPLVNHKAADSANYVGGISCKGSQDGIARSLTVIPEDTMKWLITDAVFWSGGPTKDEVRVRVRVAPAPWDGQLPEADCASPSSTDS